MKATGVAPPNNTTPQPTPTPPPPTPTPTPAPPPPPPSSGGITVGVGLGCVRNGKRMRVTLKVHKQPGKAKPKVTRVVFFYRRNKKSVVRADKSAPYKRRLPVSGLSPGKHLTYARVYYKRPGSTSCASGPCGVTSPSARSVPRVSTDTQSRVEELAARLTELRDAYYRGEPLVADADFDALDQGSRGGR